MLPEIWGTTHVGMEARWSLPVFHNASSDEGKLFLFPLNLGGGNIIHNSFPPGIKNLITLKAALYKYLVLFPLHDFDISLR